MNGKDDLEVIGEGGQILLVDERVEEALSEESVVLSDDEEKSVVVGLVV